MKKFLCAILALNLFATAAYADFSWSDMAVTFCKNRGFISGMDNGDLALDAGLTREQMASLLCRSFGYTQNASQALRFTDISADRWSCGYIGALAPYFFGGNPMQDLNPTQYVTREEFCATMVLASGRNASHIKNPNLLDNSFSDARRIDSRYKELMTVAVESGWMSGFGGLLRPTDNLNRAEACSLIFRALSGKNTDTGNNVGNNSNSTVNNNTNVEVEEQETLSSQTPIIGTPTVSLDRIKAWAKARNATAGFIAAADIYYKYGEITGIRPDILYAQSAKETAFGRYGGAVTPEMNNFAGIKRYGASGDAREDHESFATQDDGVRAHFNHMSAYVGLAPIGEPHGRYKSVKSLSWAGTVRFVEELGGKWCPDPTYGYSILNDYLASM